MYGYVLICPESQTHTPRQNKDTKSVHEYYTVYLHVLSLLALKRDQEKQRGKWP